MPKVNFFKRILAIGAVVLFSTILTLAGCGLEEGAASEKGAEEGATVSEATDETSLITDEPTDQMFLTQSYDETLDASEDVDQDSSAIRVEGSSMGLCTFICFINKGCDKLPYLEARICEYMCAVVCGET